MVSAEKTASVTEPTVDGSTTAQTEQTKRSRRRGAVLAGLALGGTMFVAACAPDTQAVPAPAATASASPFPSGGEGTPAAEGKVVSPNPWQSPQLPEIDPELDSTTGKQLESFEVGYPESVRRSTYLAATARAEGGGEKSENRYGFTDDMWDRFEGVKSGDKPTPKEQFVLADVVADELYQIHGNWGDVYKETYNPHPKNADVKIERIHRDMERFLQDPELMPEIPGVAREVSHPDQ